MKKVLILFGKCQWKKSRPFNNKKYMYSYEYFYDLCRKSEIQMYRASYEWYDYNKKIFKYAWIFKEKEGKWDRVYNIKPDLIYDKTKSRPEVYFKKDLIGKNYNFFNNLEFTSIIDNKLCTGILFSKWSKKSFLVEGKKHLSEAIRNIDSEKIVLKPIDMSGGENVIIGTKKEVIRKADSFSEKELRKFIVQGFIDSNRGIPGIMKGVHDLRIVIVNKEIAYSYYRKPAEGSLLANLAQGGTMNIVDIKKLPKSVMAIVNEANRLFSCFRSKIYTIDLMFDENKKPWIVELNSMPGMYFEEGQEKTRKNFYGLLLEAFENELNM